MTNFYLLISTRNNVFLFTEYGSANYNLAVHVDNLPNIILNYGFCT